MNERKDERNNVRSTYLRLVSQSDLNQEGEWKNEKRKTEMKKPVAQRQEMVIGTLALLNGLFMAAFQVSRASAPKGDEVL